MDPRRRPYSLLHSELPDDLSAPDISPDELDALTPESVREIFPAFRWDVGQLWKIRRPVEDMPLAEFEWLMELPLWRWRGRRFVLTPAQVLAEPDMYRAHRDKALATDLEYPIHVAASRDRWVILDGYHRLLRARIEGRYSIAAMKVRAEDLA